MVTLFSPSSVSCHTMPSRFTLVPGSQGPRHSGSVASAASTVFTAIERVRTMICSHGDETSPLLGTEPRRWRGGGAGVETGDSIWMEEREDETEIKHGRAGSRSNVMFKTKRTTYHVKEIKIIYSP